MLGFNWKFLTPLALCLLIVVAILDKLLVGTSQAVYVLVMLGANLMIVWATVLILRKYARVERKRIGEERPVAVPPDTESSELVGQE
jgi:predicted permease